MILDIQLSKRAMEVLQLVLHGKSNKYITLSLGINVRMVEFHLPNIYAKFQLSSRVELILKHGYTKDISNIEELWCSIVARRGKTPKRDASSIHEWIGYI